MVVDGLERRVGLSEDGGSDAFATEEIVGAAAAFFDAVAEEDECVAGVELDGSDFKCGDVEEADGEAVLIESVENRTTGLIGTQQEGAGVAGVDVVQTT